MFAFSAAAGFMALRLLAMTMAPTSHVVAVPVASSESAVAPVSPAATASLSSTTQSSSSYWLSSITRQGSVAFGNSTSYKVYRSVKDYGAKGMSLIFLLLILAESWLR